MADETDQTPRDAAADEQPPGFAKVSQTLRRRTTDLLALAILAVGLLAIGGKVSRWWGKSPEEAAPRAQNPPRPLAWGAGGEGVSMEWGDLEYAIHRQRLTGDAETVGGRLEDLVISYVPKITPPEFPPSDAEVKLLSELKTIPASRSLDSGTRLYRLGEHLPMILLTRLVGDSRRVVCWARAFPQSQTEWMAFLFYSAKTDATQAAPFQQIPLPEGSQRIQSLHEKGQRSWIGFKGPGPARDWQSHFDDWFAEADWKPIREWSQTPSGWTAAYQSADEKQRADIWLNRQTNEEWTGMIFVERLPNRPAQTD